MPHWYMTKSECEKIEQKASDFFDEYCPDGKKDHMGYECAIFNYIEANNIIMKDSFELGEASAVLQKEGDRWVILLNAYEGRNRQIFSLAHEVAHHYLHSSELDSFVITNLRVYRKQEERRAKIEMEANQLAGAILMPKWIIEYEDVGDDRQKMDKLANKFGVSMHALETRISILS